MKYPICAAGTLLLLSLLLTGCGAEDRHVGGHGMRGIYYWKTVMTLDSADMSFLRRHHIEKMYLRMFDVTPGHDAASGEDAVVPNASLTVTDAAFDTIRSGMSHMQFVPVVYITLEALKKMAGNEDRLAADIVERVRNMCSYNGLRNVAELQLDCDWTASTEQQFFDLCRHTAAQIREQGLDWALGSTVRLHQLGGKEPPVDRGVLMVYNTGDFRNPDEPNSIISLENVAPYLKHLPSYRLPLDVAYPAYSWQLLFRDRRFIGLMNGVDISDTCRFRRTGPCSYIAETDVPYGDMTIRQGDVVRCEQASYDMIIRVKRAVEAHMGRRSHGYVLYHLDSSNLSKYTDNEIDSIFAGS